MRSMEGNADARSVLAGTGLEKPLVRPASSNHLCQVGRKVFRAEVRSKHQLVRSN